MGEGRGRTPKSLQVHTHRHRHTLRGGLYPSAAPCSATPRDPPSPGPRPPYAAGPEAWGWSPHWGQRRAGVAPPLSWRSSRPRPLWVGTTVGLRGGVEPFVPYLSAALPNTLAASDRYRNLCSPCGVWRGGREPSLPFCPHGEPWESRGELRPEWGGRPPGPCACEGKWGFRGATTASQPALGSLRTGTRDGRSWTLRESLAPGDWR